MSPGHSGDQAQARHQPRQAAATLPSTRASCLYHGLGATQTIAAGYSSGINTLDFVISGDQVTDGFIYNTTGFSARALPASTVPEPSTYLLLASGLGALGLVARRRRTRG